MVIIIFAMVIMLGLTLFQSTQLSTLARQAQLSQQLESGMLTLRRNEKDFLARVDLKYVDKFNSNFNALINHADQYKQLDAQNSRMDEFRKIVSDYKQQFSNLVGLQKKIGLNPKEGFYGELRDAVHQIEDSVKSQQQYQLLAYTLMLRRREKDFMLRLDPSYVDKFRADIQVLQNSTKQSPIPQAMKMEIAANIDNYQLKFMALVDAMKIMGLDHKSGILGELRETIQQTESILEKLMAENQQKIESSRSFIKWVAFFVVLLTATLVCGFTFFSSRSILRPIKEINHKIRLIRQSDDLALRANDEGEDELAEMAGHFNSLMDEFQYLVHDVNLALGNLNEAATKLTSNAGKTHSEVQNQLSETDMVATAVTQMGSTIDEIAQNTEQAAFKSNETNSNAKEGYQEVMATASSISDLSSQLDEAGHEVQDLEQDVKNIGSVLDVIRGIADQTNLLALNAAIEAARAGEQGRGFAVVADEVRNLAMRTQESTQEIEQIIKTLQSRTGNVVELMSHCRSKGDNSSAQAKKTGSLLMQITEDVTMISDMSIQIAAAIEEQSKVASEVNHNVVKIRDIAERSNNNAQMFTSVSDEVASQASRLVTAVSKFNA
jgi:methyl-accepting chemotaxis protein